MSLLELHRFIDDASGDADLWVKIMEWPHEVLQLYSLSDDELDALRNGDLELLQEFGVDDYHLSKVQRLLVYR